MSRAALTGFSGRGNPYRNMIIAAPLMRLMEAARDAVDRGDFAPLLSAIEPAYNFHLESRGIFAALAVTVPMKAGRELLADINQLFEQQRAALDTIERGATEGSAAALREGLRHLED